jgi:hypothetical protein
MGFVFSFLGYAIHQGKDDCPDGFAGPLREAYIETLPASERARLSRPENEVELTNRWKAYATGPNNINICSHPQMFDRPPQKLLKGRVAYGLNLDDDTGNGSASPAGCTHQNFTSPDGQPGVDNQVWRAMGCYAGEGWRGKEGSPQELERGFKQFLISGEHSQVLLLRGVDSLVRDDDVQVIYANTEDPAIVDSNQKFLTGASYSVTNKREYRNVLRGRIDNGVLTTEPRDVRLRQTWGQSAQRDVRGRRAEWDLRRARLRLTFQADGSVKGIVGGYQPIWNVIQSPSIGGIGSATTAGIDCAGQYAALKLMADGDRDPKTGQCTTISTALRVEAVSAFVNDRAPTRNIAAQ